MEQPFLMAVRTIPAVGTTVEPTNPANVAVGAVSITIAVANTPVAATVVGLGLDGPILNSVYALATAQTSTPHLVIASATYTLLTDTLTIWLNRTTIGTTEVDYIAWRNY
jgi:hypothetical protein